MVGSTCIIRVTDPRTHQTSSLCFRTSGSDDSTGLGNVATLLDSTPTLKFLVTITDSNGNSATYSIERESRANGAYVVVKNNEGRPVNISVPMLLAKAFPNGKGQTVRAVLSKLAHMDEPKQVANAFRQSGNGSVINVNTLVAEVILEARNNQDNAAIRQATATVVARKTALPSPVPPTTLEMWSASVAVLFGIGRSQVNGVYSDGQAYLKIRNLSVSTRADSTNSFIDLAVQSDGSIRAADLNAVSQRFGVTVSIPENGSISRTDMDTAVAQLVKTNGDKRPQGAIALSIPITPSGGGAGSLNAPASAAAAIGTLTTGAIATDPTQATFQLVSDINKLFRINPSEKEKVDVVEGGYIFITKKVGNMLKMEQLLVTSRGITLSTLKQVAAKLGLAISDQGAYFLDHGADSSKVDAGTGRFSQGDGYVSPEELKKAVALMERVGKGAGNLEKVRTDYLTTNYFALVDSEEAEKVMSGKIDSNAKEGDKIKGAVWLQEYTPSHLRAAVLKVLLNLTGASNESALGESAYCLDRNKFRALIDTMGYLSRKNKDEVQTRLGLGKDADWSQPQSTELHEFLPWMTGKSAKHWGVEKKEKGEKKEGDKDKSVDDREKEIKERADLTDAQKAAKIGEMHYGEAQGESGAAKINYQVQALQSYYNALGAYGQLLSSSPKFPQALYLESQRVYKRTSELYKTLKDNPRSDPPEKENPTLWQAVNFLLGRIENTGNYLEEYRPFFENSQNGEKFMRARATVIDVMTKAQRDSSSIIDQLGAARELVALFDGSGDLVEEILKLEVGSKKQPIIDIFGSFMEQVSQRISALIGDPKNPKNRDELDKLTAKLDDHMDLLVGLDDKKYLKDKGKAKGIIVGAAAAFVGLGMAYARGIHGTNGSGHPKGDPAKTKAGKVLYQFWKGLKAIKTTFGDDTIKDALSNATTDLEKDLKEAKKGVGPVMDAIKREYGHLGGKDIDKGELVPPGGDAEKKQAADNGAQPLTVRRAGNTAHTPPPAKKLPDGGGGFLPTEPGGVAAGK